MTSPQRDSPAWTFFTVARSLARSRSQTRLLFPCGCDDPHTHPGNHLNARLPFSVCRLNALRGCKGLSLDAGLQLIK